MTKQKVTILLIDSSSVARTIIRRMLEPTQGRGSDISFSVIECGGLAAAQELLKQHSPDLILTGLNLADSIGLDTITRITELCSHVPIVVLTGTEGEEAGMQAIHYGAQDYLVKGNVSSDVLKRTLIYALERGKLRKIVQEHKQALEILAGKLSKYLSPQVFRSIFKGENQVNLKTERKLLTVFFSDIVGFTPKADAMPQAELSAWLNNYLNNMAEIALRHGGTLDKFIGDAVMVFFGDPETKGQTADACNCLEMAREMLEKSKELGVAVRMGIHSGLCIVGNFGSENRMDYTIIGRTVNLASRLESNAEPNRILLSEMTYRLVKDRIKCTPRGKIAMKGIARPVMTYWGDLLSSEQYPYTI